tara:strand:+ start:10439 stop:12691 length:2253 start_codon:yes stop_codon:yes gene_type:complete
MLDFNIKQTSISPKEWEDMEKEIRNELVELFESVKFIQLLTAKDRPYAKDRPRNSEGKKIIVDIINPHILENMDYFREAALHFDKYKCYTKLYPNKHRQSAYYKHWKREADRCRNGLVRESDGEWITGDYYYYLNYGRIYLTKTKVGSKRAERIEAFPYVYDGDYLYFHYLENCREDGKHGSVLKARGRGFSFKGGAGLAKHFVLGATAEANTGVKAFAIADEREYLTKDGVLNKYIDMVDHCSKHTPWPRVRDLKDSWNEMHWKMGYKDPDSNAELGTKNEVMGVTLKNDADKARGKRGAYIIWEEMGKFPCILKAWGVARPSVEDGNFAFGTMIAYGTGGTSGANFAGAEELFYYPGGYNIHAIPNIFDKNQDGKNKCGFFFSEYLNRTGFYDKDGNSDVIGALIELLTNRELIRKEASDPNTLVQEKAERPITPQEAIMRKEGSVFPTADLKDYLSDIMPKVNKFTSPHWVGRLALQTDGEVEWKVDDGVTPNREFPIQAHNNKEGAIELFEMPYKDSRGETPAGLYISGIDPIDDDDSSTNSMFSMFVLNTLTDRIVAEYTGRTFSAEDCYEKARRLLIFYNAQANYENDKKGLYGYLRNKNCLHLLADTPEIIRDMDMGTISRIGNKSKGCNSSKKLNAWGRRLQATWQIQKSYTQNEEEEELTLLNLHKIRSIGYIKECIAWNPDINTDRVSAMGMLMILRADREQRIVDFEVTDKGLETDSFWTRGYKTETNILGNYTEQQTV